MVSWQLGRSAVWTKRVRRELVGSSIKSARYAGRLQDNVNKNRCGCRASELASNKDAALNLVEIVVLAHRFSFLFVVGQLSMQQLHVIAHVLVRAARFVQSKRESSHQTSLGYGSKLKHQGTAGFSP